MPAYDFKCITCGEVTEVTRPSTDDTAVSCSACGGGTRRLFNAVGVHFKGSGFHSTDYKKKDAPAAETPPCGSSDCAPACGSCCQTDK